MTVAAAGWNAARRRAFRTMLLPALMVLGLVTAGPALHLVATSLTPLNLTMPGTAWDFSEPAFNYRELLEDDRFHRSAWLQAQLSAATVALQLLMGLGVALLLHGGGRLRRAARTLLLIPMVLPPIAVGILWRVMYTVDISPFHRFMAWIGLPVPPLITDPHLALWAIVAVETWEWFPFTMLMALAALQMVPEGPVEAARIDGASDLQLFRHVLLPCIAPTLLVAALFRLIDSIKAFPLIFILTEGGPGSVTEVTNYYSFLQAFNFSFLGYSSAITVVLLAATILMSAAIIRLVGWGQHGD